MFARVFFSPVALASAITSQPRLRGGKLFTFISNLKFMSQSLKSKSAVLKSVVHSTLIIIYSCESETDI